MICQNDFYRNNYDVIKQWAESNDTNVFIGRGTALGLASFMGKARTVKMLVKNGALPNFPSCIDWTPLIFASNGCRLNVIKYLLSIGADVNAVDNRGQTALHHLCCAHRLVMPDAARVLIDAGIDIRIKNVNGLMACDLAEENKRYIPNYGPFSEIITPTVE